MNVLNIYGEDSGEPVELPYIKKTGDTATGLIIFDAGIEVNNGTTAINGPAEFADTVLFKPSSTVTIDGSVELTGPSFIVSCQTTEFNGAQTTFNGPLIDIVGAAATTLNTDCVVNINTTNHNNVNVECPVNLGTFASLNLLDADINMEDDSIINQFGTRTQNNVLGTTEIINGSVIQYNSDNTQQSSAYTGAGALAGSYIASDITLDSDGRITAISNGTTPTSLTINNLYIPIGGLNIYSPGLGGIQNPVNNGGKAYIFGNSSTTSANYVPAGVASQGFLISFQDGSFTNLIKLVTVRVTFSYVIFDAGNTNIPYQWAKTYFDMDLYPSTFNTANVTAYPMSQYQINNSISGNSDFYQTSALIPQGRPYWCYNQNYAGPSSLLSTNFGYICPFISTPPPFVVPNRWAIFPTVQMTLTAANTVQYEGSIEVLNCQAANNFNVGVGVSAINAI
jgi:hypothetical protein